MGKGGGSGGGTNTVVQNSQPPAEVLAQYQNVIAQANKVAQTPFTTGGFNASNMIAPFSDMQNQGFNTLNSTANSYQPFLNNAQGFISNSQTPIWNNVQQYGDSMNNYMNPYLNQAVAATRANINETNAEQNQQVVGNAISSGAWGGDRASVAQAELARQQGLVNNQTIANMENTGFAQQQQEFNAQQGAQIGANEANAWLASQAGALENGLANTTQALNVNEGNALLNAGQQQQQQQQAALNIPYEQFQAQTAYPFQTTGWLSDISTGVGGSMGATGTTTSPAANTTSQMIGNLGGLGLLGYEGLSAAASLGGYASIGAMFSDRRLKENIKHIGTMRGRSGRDYPIYTYNFKGDPETRMGVIAQDVEKIHPLAVGKSHGFKTVDYKKLASGGFVPNYDDGGGIGGPVPGELPVSALESGAVPNIGLTGIRNPNVRAVHLAPPPKPYETPQQNNSGSLGAIAGLIKSSSGVNSDNPLGLSSGSGFTNGDLGKLYADFQNNGGGFAPGEFAMANGGYVHHYDNGGGIGGLTPAMTEMSPFMQNQYSQYENLPTEKLQELAARLGPTPQARIIQAALQKKQMMSSAMPQPAAVSPTMPTMARGGKLQHFDGSDGSVVQPVPIDDQYTKDLSEMYNAPPVNIPSGLAPASQTPVVNVPKSLSPSSTSDIPDHDTWMKNYQNEVMNAAPYTKPDPLMNLFGTMAAIGSGRSPQLGVNMGEGALKGIENIQAQNKEAAAESEKRGSLQEQGEQLYNTMIQHKEQMAHENEQLQETTRHNKAEEANARAERQKPIPDGFGGFIIPNPLDPQHPAQINLGGSGGDPSQVSIANIYNPPKNDKGEALHGTDFLKTIPAPIASQAMMYVEGNAPPPTGFASKPALLAAHEAATVADPSYVGTRFSTLHDFTTSGTQANQTVRAQNATMEHMTVLQDAVTALNNGDTRAFNSLANQIAKQAGQPAPTNMEMAQTIVADEMAKAILGPRVTQGDRQEFAKNLTTSAGRQQLQGQLDEGGKLMAGQADTLEKSYNSGTGLDVNKTPADIYSHLNYRDKFMLPNARKLIEKYYPSEKPRAQGSQQQSQVLATPPKMEERIVGQSYNTPKGAAIWTKDGWQLATPGAP